SPSMFPPLLHDPLPIYQLLALFRGFLERESATVLEIESRQQIPSAIADYLRSNNLPARIRVGGDAMLTQLPWGSEPHLEMLLGRDRKSTRLNSSHVKIS